MKIIWKELKLKCSLKTRINICILWKKVLSKKYVKLNDSKLRLTHNQITHKSNISQVICESSPENSLIIPAQEELTNNNFTFGTDNVFDVGKHSLEGQNHTTNLKWVFEAEISVNLKENLTSKENIRLTISETLISYKNSCVISFDTIWMRNKIEENIVAYGRCKYLTHLQRFKFMINTQDKLKIYLTEEKCESHEGKKLYEKVRGNRRILMKEKLRHITAHNVSLDLRTNTDIRLVNSGNTMKLTTNEVLRKLRSEVLKKSVY